MKRLLSIALAFSLLGSSVAMARGYDGYAERSHNNYSASYRGYEHSRDHSGNAGLAIGAGILALGLFGALASQHDDYAPSYYAPAPPPPAYAYPGYGYATPGYNYGYGY